MLKAERIEISGLANALYGMRLPKLSHDKSDSNCLVYDFETNTNKNIKLNDVTTKTKVIKVNIGENDKRLANNLVIAGTDHGKWLRQVQVSLCITAPMTFWWDFDTYKVATVKNSSSRMHKLGSRYLTSDDFSWDDLDGNLNVTMFRQATLNHLNDLIDRRSKLMKQIKEKDYSEYSLDILQEELDEIYRQLINDLPDSYNFTATWTGSAQTCRNYYFARRYHKQKEIRDLAIVFGNLDEIGGFITTTELIK